MNVGRKNRAADRTAPPTALDGKDPHPGFRRHGKYKSHDHKTHEAAHALAQAAKNKDGVATIAAFQSVQAGCYGCHREFRKPFVEHFYGVR